MLFVPVLYKQLILSMLGNTGPAAQLALDSEVGVFTGEGPECDLFVLLCDDVVPTERPTKTRISISILLKPDEQSGATAHLSWCSRGVRRTRRTRSLYLGFSTLPVENLSDIFTTDLMSLSNCANNLVSVNLLNLNALLMETKIQGCERTCGWRLQNSAVLEVLLVDCCHCFLVSTVEFNC